MSYLHVRQTLGLQLSQICSERVAAEAIRSEMQSVCAQVDASVDLDVAAFCPDASPMLSPTGPTAFCFHFHHRSRRYVLVPNRLVFRLPLLYRRPEFTGSRGVYCGRYTE